MMNGGQNGLAQSPQYQQPRPMAAPPMQQAAAGGQGTGQAQYGQALQAGGGGMQGLAQAAPHPLTMHTMGSPATGPGVNASQGSPNGMTTYYGPGNTPLPQSSNPQRPTQTGWVPGNAQSAGNLNDPNSYESRMHDWQAGPNAGDPSSRPLPTGYAGGTQGGGDMPLYTGMMGNQNDVVQRYGTDNPSIALPPVRVPGQQYNQGQFSYNGTGQGQWNQGAQSMMGNAGPQGAWGQSDQSRGQMQDAAGLYRAMANGQGPNLAGAQFQQGLDQSIQAQMAAANSGRGGALAQAGAQQAAAQRGQQMQAAGVSQAAQLAGQQQLAGMQGYGQMAGQIRQGDYGQASSQLNADMMARGQNYNLANTMMGYGQHAADQDMAGRTNYATTQGASNQATQLANANLQAGFQAQQAENAQRMGSTAVNAGAAGVAGLFGTMAAFV